MAKQVFKPHFEKTAKEHAGRALFISCMGDSNGSTAKIMKRLAIKCAALMAVPLLVWQLPPVMHVPLLCAEP